MLLSTAEHMNPQFISRVAGPMPPASINLKHGKYPVLSSNESQTMSAGHNLDFLFFFMHGFSVSLTTIFLNILLSPTLRELILEVMF